MEENAKKTLMIVVAVVCLAAAGIVTYKTMGGGTTAGQPTGKVWVKCNNPKCGNEYQISAKEYSDFIMKNGGPRQIMMSGTPAMNARYAGTMGRVQGARNISIPARNAAGASTRGLMSGVMSAFVS